MRVFLPLALVLVLPVIGGCGAARNDLGSLSVEPSAKTRALDYPKAGLSLELPRNAEVRRARAPGVFLGSLGDALVSAFAYRRKEQIPGDAAELRAARRRLERAARQRDASFRLRESTVTRVAGARAVELLGDQTIARGRLRTRSLHVYKGKAEYVIELLAPVRRFAALDRAISPTIRRSLKLTGEVGPAGQG